MRRVVVLAVVAGSLVAGCSPAIRNGLVPVSSVPAAASGYQLVPAQSAECQQEGEQVARYLDTGQPTSLDPTYGNERQDVLGESGEQRALTIRQDADKVIQQCDTASGSALATTILSTQPFESVRAVYDAIGQGGGTQDDMVAKGCGRFREDVQHEFAADMGFPTCREAVLALHAEVTDVNDYLESIYPRQYDPNAASITIDSCDFTIKGGPALGVFAVTKVEKGQWLITGHAPGPKTCPR